MRTVTKSAPERMPEDSSFHQNDDNTDRTAIGSVDLQIWPFAGYLVVPTCRRGHVRQNIQNEME